MKTYIIDYLNVFSDYRETFYKENGQDFHDIKYISKEIDTRNFFDLFFTKYTSVAKIDSKSHFIFVFKKMYNYQDILMSILDKYKHLYIRFIIIPDRYNNALVESNKDDFICQYLLTVYNDTILVSNDKYDNRETYLYLYKELYKMNIQILMQGYKVDTFFIINNNVISKIKNLNLRRTSILKRNFNTMY